MIVFLARRPRVLAVLPRHRLPPPPAKFCPKQSFRDLKVHSGGGLRSPPVLIRFPKSSQIASTTPLRTQLRTHLLNSCSLTMQTAASPAVAATVVVAVVVVIVGKFGRAVLHAPADLCMSMSHRVLPAHMTLVDRCPRSYTFC